MNVRMVLVGAVSLVAPIADCLAVPQGGTGGRNLNAVGGIATVTDVDSDAKGRIYIADERRGMVHILDDQLRQIGGVGDRGRGEGQYMDLQAVRVIDGSSFIAVERYLKRLNIYRWVDSAPRLVKSIAVPFEPYDLCVLPGGQYLVVGHYRNRKLHRVNSAGQVVASAAPVDSTVDTLIADRVTPGRVTCDPSSGDVTLTSFSVPLVEFYDRSLVQTDREYLAPMRVQKIQVMRDGGRTGISISAGPLGYHLPGRALLLGNRRVIGARAIVRPQLVLPDSVRWFAYDRKTKTLTAPSDGVGRMFPLRNGAILLVRESGSVELERTSMKQLQQAIPSR